MDGDYLDIKLKAAVMTLLDPHRGAEVSFNRHYERQRRFQTVILGPDVIAGARFVARRTEKATRRILDPTVDPDRGTFLNLYWLIDDPARNNEYAAMMTKRLDEEHRTNYDRSPYMSFRPLYRFGQERDASGVPPEHALDHRFPGLAFVRIEPNDGVDVDQLSDWYRKNCAPEITRPDSPVALCLGFVGARRFTPAHFGDVPSTDFPPDESHFLVFWFFDLDPQGQWEELADRQEAIVADAGIGKVTWASSFIATNVGTDDYMDELWLDAPSN